ncbi:MAG: hypothetical protein U0R78_12325 [Nocardioidaceae bacterium]
MSDSVGVEGTGMGHLHDQPVPREDRIIAGYLFQDLFDVVGVRVRDLDGDITSRSGCPAQFDEDIVDGGEVSADTCSWIIDE